MAFKVAFAAQSHLGLKRKVNEDSFFADEGIGLFMVLDGIGGQRAGEVASKLGMETIKENVIMSLKSKSVIILGDQYEDLSREAAILNNSLVLANRVIYDVAHSQEEYCGMGTTVASLLLGETSLAIAHLGDSRIYLVRNKTIERLTEDHSLVMEQLRRGMIDEAEAERSDMKNIITRALGAEENVYPEINELVPCVDDLFLLCSDGLSDLVTDDEILDIVWERGETLEGACQKLIDTANERGGKDNITTIAISFRKCPSKLRQYYFLVKEWLQSMVS